MGDGWGAILVLAVLAGIGTLGVLLAPLVAPAVRLPGSKGSLLVLLGAVALLAWIPPLVAWLDHVAGNLLNFATLQFLLGFGCAAALAWTGFVAYRAEGGVLRLGSNPAASPDPAPKPRHGEPEDARGSVAPSDVDAEP